LAENGVAKLLNLPLILLICTTYQVTIKKKLN
jgi:hypothetical protein